MPPADPKSRARLRDIIAERSLTRGQFKLASGGESNIFFDMKTTLLDPEGAALAAALILDMLGQDQVDAIGGLVIGACPVVSAVCVTSAGRGRPVPGFYVRKEPKGRGTNKLIEGNLEPGWRVVVVEDVTTEGNSALKAVRAVREHGCTVVKVVTVVDRLQGARENLKKEGIELAALFTRDDFSV
jgi:orotate phosphoribosyltransferase